MERAVLSCLTGSALWRVAALGIVLLGFAADSSIPVTAGAGSLEARRQPMKFGWVACDPDCGGWISAVGIVTVDTPKAFDDFARDRQLRGATVVLDSSGGSVNDAIALGRRWRALGLATTVGISVSAASQLGNRPRIEPAAYCESMCAFLLLSGQTRYVSEGARVRVHQIWMGDRAEDARAASYTAQDMSIVERDIGRLAKFTFDMGGTGDLLSIALSVPPWEDLHELTRQELRDSNLITTQLLADLLPGLGSAPAKAVASAAPKPAQDRFTPQPAAATKTAEALPTGGTAAAQPGH
uniref:Periplasmic protein-like protein n=1 Tax=Rhodopseudomonas palustris (strain DX-1) TaxID=652103 RepID=E6VNH9_RHOPX